MLEPSRAGLKTRRGSGSPAAKASDGRPRVSTRSAAYSRGAHLHPGQDRQLQRAADALEERLVHAHRGRRRSGAAVGQADRLEQRLDLAVLAERPVQGREDDGLRAAAGQLLQRRGARERARAPSAAGSWKAVAGRPGRAPPTGSATSAPSRSMSQPLTRGRAPRSAVAMARPETSETSCSADGPPRSTRWRSAAGSRRASPRGIVSFGGSRAPRRRSGRPVAREHDLVAQVDAALPARTMSRTRSPRRRTSAARGAAWR